MADDSIALLPDTGIERRIDPQVLSKADPSAPDLLQARRAIQAQPALQGLFLKAKEESWAVEELTRQLTVALGGPDWSAAAQYLADEYTQIGAEGIYLVSTDTGRILAVIQEDDIYQPAPVAREGSDRLANPLPRLRPELEGAIVTFFHDKGREERILEALAARGHTTQLLRDMGDPRLLVATKKGRRHIVASLAKYDPKDLLGATGGTAGAFLQFFQIVAEVPESVEGLTHLEGQVSSKSIMRVQDALTTNLHHNRPASLRGALVQGWVRQIASRISHVAHESGAVVVLDTNRASSLPGRFWVAPPDMVRPFLKIDPKASILPVDTSKPITIDGPLGYLKIPSAFRAHSGEISDRWETSAVLDFEAWVDLTNICPYEVVGVEVLAQVL